MKRVKEQYIEEEGILEDMMGKSPGFLSDFFRTALAIGLLLAVTFVILNFLGQRVSVDGNSMLPMLSNGDQLLVDKISYRFSDPERYDIVVFGLKEDSSIHYIKRVIGLPGETVQIIDGAIFINGQVLGEPYGLEVMQDAKRASEPIVLGENEYFVLGDNRNDSKDSRSQEVGNVNRSQLMGKAFVRIWPVSQLGVLRHQ